MTAPDVSVVVAVYNTMPYLTRCMTSLVEQTIGPDRLEVVAVDDGSTDGSGAELDRFAARYPGTVRVVHQANSGGPARPSNRGLQLAQGRYVFFVGADDYLGPDALRRLVAAADRDGSDVTLGRVVGVNGRYVHQAVFARTEPDIGLFDSALPWSLSNTKLFRRELVRRHALRFPEDMPVGSDQPFTLAACLHARRISVLADYDYYYAVRRHNAGNISYRSRPEERLRCAESIMDFVAGLIEPGKQRDAVLVRHFTWELAKLLGPGYLRLDRVVQERVHAGVRELARRYLTDHLRDQLPAGPRLRLCVARDGDAEELVAAVRTQTQGADWLARLDAIALGREHAGGPVLTVTARSARRDLAALCRAQLAMTAGSVPATVTTTADATGTTVHGRFSVAALLAEVPGRGAVHTVRSQLRAFDRTGSAPLRAPVLPPAPRLVVRRGARLYLVRPTVNHRGQLAIAVAPLTPARTLARLRRRRPRAEAVVR